MLVSRLPRARHKKLFRGTYERYSRLRPPHELSHYFLPHHHPRFRLPANASATTQLLRSHASISRLVHRHLVLVPNHPHLPRHRRSPTHPHRHGSSDVPSILDAHSHHPLSHLSLDASPTPRRRSRSTIKPRRETQLRLRDSALRPSCTDHRSTLARNACLCCDTQSRSTRMSRYDGKANSQERILNSRIQCWRLDIKNDSQTPQEDLDPRSASIRRPPHRGPLQPRPRHRYRLRNRSMSLALRATARSSRADHLEREGSGEDVWEGGVGHHISR